MGPSAIIDPGAPGRLTVWPKDGSEPELLRFPGALPWDGSGRGLTLDDGSVLIAGQDPAGGEAWTRLDLGRAAVLDTVRLPDPPARDDLTPPAGPFRAPWTPEFERTPAADGGVGQGWTDRYQVVRVPVDGSGDGGIVAERSVEPHPVPPAERRAAREALEEIALDFGDGTEVLPPVPAVKPLFQSLEATPDGRLVLRIHGPSVFDGEEWGEATIWDVFRDGRFEGRIQLPPEHDLLWLEGDVFWTLFRDELGVESLRRYRLEPPGPSG